MRVYVAGKMSGLEHYGVEAFEQAASAWRAVHGRDFDPRRDVCDWGDPLLPEMLAADFAALCRAEAVALLPGWESSKGSRAEILVALNLGKPIYDAATFERLPLVATVLIRHEAAA